MKITENFDLFPLNTFGVHSQARYFVTISNASEFRELLQTDIYRNNEHFILGGGSNILLTKDIAGLVIKNNIKGIEQVEENNDDVVLKVGAGENWNDFVLWCIDKNLAGLENLTLIPGNVGASPMQNIGAYGVEVKDRIVQVECLDLADGSLKTFSNNECEFAYRSSIFKTSAKGKYFITHVHYKLSKKPHFETSYGAIEKALEEMNVTELSIKHISDAVAGIRSSKLPDPKKIGNAGSFFKNPSVALSKAEELLKTHPEMPHFNQNDGTVKIPAGWLIEQAGWKGKVVGNCGVHEKQALVIVNHGSASGREIAALSDQIQKSIHNEFGILLEKEVNII